MDDLITQTLRAQYEAEKAAHTPSGKLSAGYLGKPLVEQVLKLRGVPEKEIDDYTLRLFERGKQVEKWIASMIPGEEQKEVMYRNVIGYVDKFTDKPIEIKSVKNSQWKYLKEPRWSHRLQAGLYALGTNSLTYTIIYVASDDFRVKEFTERTEDIKEDIDRIITEVEQAMQRKDLPRFKPREDWQKNPKYLSYPEYVRV